ALNIFGPHIAFGDDKVSQQVAKRELSSRAAPIDLVRRNKARDPHCSLAYAGEVFQEGLNREDFHDATSRTSVAKSLWPGSCVDAVPKTNLVTLCTDWK